MERVGIPEESLYHDGSVCVVLPVSKEVIAGLDDISLVDFVTRSEVVGSALSEYLAKHRESADLPDMVQNARKRLELARQALEAPGGEYQI